MINSRASNPTIQAVFDILCGFAAFFIVLLVSFITREQQDIRSFLLAVCVAFFVVGYLRARGRSGRVALRFLFIVIGGIAPAIALKELRIALTAPPVKGGAKPGQWGGVKVGQWMGMKLLSMSGGRASGA